MSLKKIDTGNFRAVIIGVFFIAYIAFLSSNWTPWGETNYEDRFYCKSDIYVEERSDGWYLYRTRSNECDSCVAGSSDVSQYLGGPFATREEACRNY